MQWLVELENSSNKIQLLTFPTLGIDNSDDSENSSNTSKSGDSGDSDDYDVSEEVKTPNDFDDCCSKIFYILDVK